eukprot:gene1270-4478_t
MATATHRKQLFDSTDDHSHLLLQQHLQSSSDNIKDLSIVCWNQSKLRKHEQIRDAIWLLIDRIQPLYQRNNWDWEEKKEELTANDMHFVILMQEDFVIGFAAFMLDEEDAQWVVYCYDLHVAECCQGKGYGRLLIQFLETISKAIDMNKIMLTCFKDNPAMNFYLKLGFKPAYHSPSMCGDDSTSYEILMKSTKLSHISL